MSTISSFSEEKLQEIGAHFAFKAKPTSIARFGSGHINDTFLAQGKPSYILQRLNTKIFTNPEGVMANIESVTKELAKKIQLDGGDPLRQTMTLIPTKDGTCFYRDGEGGFWRAYLYIDDSLSLDLPRNAQDFKESAIAFGQFQHYLRDYPAKTLFTSIPHFHDTPKRYRDFLEAVKNDGVGRKSGVLAEIAFIEEREKTFGTVEDELRNGTIPLRVTHNDTKLNNVLLDKETGKALAVIDLDTIMPGSALYDFGDSIRFGANTAKEDEKDFSKVSLSLPLFQTYVDGYLEGCANALTKKEIEQLPLGAYLMTIECGMRFLMDYLNGDTYFRTDYPEHNLVRAKGQLLLVQDMEKKKKELTEIIKMKESQASL
jgi:hypothetical protein